MLPVPDLYLCFICRMCHHMERAVETSGIRRDVRCGVEGCKGPSEGGAFAKYDGPLKPVLLAVCYRCGNDSEGLLSADDGRLGICERCAKLTGRL